MTSVYQRVKHEVGRWIEAFTPDEEPPEVDLEYIRSVEYLNITVGIDTEQGELARCDLCGRLFKMKNTPKLINHVADHDGQGQAEVDPFETHGMADVAVSQKQEWEV